jgi:hypothetical protein
MTDRQTGARLPDEEALTNEISDQALERACYCDATAISTLIALTVSLAQKKARFDSLLFR